MNAIPEPPPKPKRMSEKRYRDLYDSDPTTVEVREAGQLTARLRTCGPVSAYVVARTYQRDGADVHVRPTRPNPTVDKGKP